MNSSRNSKRRTGRQLAMGLLTAGIASVGLAAPACAVGNQITVRPAFVNLANQGAVVFGGTAEPGITTVQVGVDDRANDLTAPVVVSVTFLAGTVEQDWQTPPMILTPLSDGPLTVLSTYNDAPATDLIVLKDTEAPEAPTFSPDSGTYPSAQNVTIESLTDQVRMRSSSARPRRSRPRPRRLW